MNAEARRPSRLEDAELMIRIETGPMPDMADPRPEAAARTELQQAIVRMPPGSWFLVPGTAKKTARQTAGVRSGISRFCKRMGLVGVATGFAADGSGLIVRKTGELQQGPAHNGVRPPLGVKPKASRL